MVCASVGVSILPEFANALCVCLSVFVSVCVRARAFGGEGLEEVLSAPSVLLGAPVGSEAFSRATVAERVEKLAELLEKVSALQNPQIQLSLVRSCFGLPKFAYCLRTCDPASVIEQFGSFDTAQCRALSNIAGTPLSIQVPAWILAS